MASIVKAVTDQLAPLVSGAKTDFEILVYTGSKIKAGTNASVSCILHCEEEHHSQVLKLDHLTKDDFKRGACDKFDVPNDGTFGMTRNSKVVELELWMENATLDLSPNWFVDKIEVVNRNNNTTYPFPVLRWLEPTKRYRFPVFDTSLPQNDTRSEVREEELVKRRTEYKLDMPLKEELGCEFVMCGGVPPAEKFPLNYEAHLGLIGLDSAVKKALALVKDKNERWESVNELLLSFDKYGFPIPAGITNWNDDSNFGAQRLTGVNHSTLYLLKELKDLPANFPVTEELVGAFLEERSLAEAVKQKRIFFSDLWAVAGAPHKDGFALCAPLALFYLDERERLLPVAIQLYQTSSPDNPIFTPAVSQNLWTLVKMWYNNADAAHHEAVTHLGTTHIVVEGVAVVSNRQLSLSHPVYKLLAPHFLYLIALDDLAKSTLINPDGFIDQAMNPGRRGVLHMTDAALRKWRLDTDGCLPADLARRGLQDMTVLPNYHFRNDAILLWQAISEYVSEYVSLYYPDVKSLKQDRELQSWAAELVKDKNEFDGGLGMKGVPGNGEIGDVSELAAICTSVIYTASVGHAAANFQQYDQYAFVPNYPSQLLGKPPTSTDVTVTSQDVMDALPARDTTMTVWVVLRLLSEKATESLGYHEVQYIFEPKALAVLEKFRKALKAVGETIEERNRRRALPYDTLHPQSVPNAISI